MKRRFHSLKFVHLELESKKGKGDLQGQPQKPTGYKGAEAYGLATGSHSQNTGTSTAAGLAGCRPLLLEINTHTLSINTTIFTAATMGF